MLYNSKNDRGAIDISSISEFDRLWGDMKGEIAEMKIKVKGFLLVIQIRSALLSLKISMESYLILLQINYNKYYIFFYLLKNYLKSKRIADVKN